jgi:hypothetical protein
MDREMENLRSRDVYGLVPRMPGMRTLCLSWALHRKFKNSTFEKNKARLVAQGDHQCTGVNYGQSFSPVMRLESLRTLLALVAIWDLDVIQFDVTSAYLHGTLKEEFYMEQTEGYTALGKGAWIWRPKKGLYGFVQASRAWDEELNPHTVSGRLAATLKDLLSAGRIPGTGGISSPEESGWPNSAMFLLLYTYQYDFFLVLPKYFVLFEGEVLVMSNENHLRVVSYSTTFTLILFARR